MVGKTNMGGGGLPSDWAEKVTATAAESIAKGDAVEYRMYPGNEVFNGATEVLATGVHTLVYTQDRKFRVYASASTLYIEELIGESYAPVHSEGAYNANQISSVEAFRVGEILYVFISYQTFQAVHVCTWDGTAFDFVSTYTLYTGSTVYTRYLKLSLDGNYLAVCKTKYGTDFCTFDFDTGVLTKQYTAFGASDAVAYNADCTNDGVYWIVNALYSGTDRVYIIKRNGSTFVQLTYFSVNQGHGRGCAFSPDGSQFAFHSETSPRLYVYNFIDEIATPLPDPAVTPPSSVDMGGSNSLQYSPDGAHLYVGTYTPTSFMAYRTHTDSAYEKLANPVFLPSSSCTGVRVSANGKVITVYSGSQVVTNYLTGYGEHIVPFESLLKARQFMLNQYGYFGVGMAKTAAEAGAQCTATLFKKINDAGV